MDLISKESVVCVLWIVYVFPKWNWYFFVFSFQATDVRYFLYILGVFVLAYGIGRHAILNRHEYHSVSTIYGMIMIPYFQLFGELFLDYPQDSRKWISSFYFLIIFESILQLPIFSSSATKFNWIIQNTSLKWCCSKIKLSKKL